MGVIVMKTIFLILIAFFWLYLALADENNLIEVEKPVAIYHAFDTNYDDITEGDIFKIRNNGYTHIQISPTQKSLEYGEWHDKYQVIGYEVNNRYGDQEALKRLTERAHRHQTKVIADVVFNHLASISGIEGRDWESAIAQNNEARIKELKKRLFNTYAPLFPGSTEDRVFEYFQFWNPTGWLGGNLPQLNTLNPLVKEVQIRFLRTLLELGIDGFRFDAVAHIALETVESYLKVIGKSHWSYGEVVNFDTATTSKYGRVFSITDYIFTNELIQSFSYDGSLSRLKIPNSNGFSDSVTFAVTHDTWAAAHTGGKSGVNITFPDEQDGDLAALYVLARHNGVPLILAKDAEKPSVRAAVRFRNEMVARHAPMEVIMDSADLCSNCSNQTLILMARGEVGFAILNKSIKDVTVQELDFSRYSDVKGCYQDIDSGYRVYIYEESGRKIMRGTRDTFVIPKRDGSFFSQISSGKCLERDK
jgi:alpha-amylase